LEDTDKRIAVYVKELEKSRASEALYTSLGRGIRAALTTPDLPPEPEIAPQLSNEFPNIQMPPHSTTSVPQSTPSAPRSLPSPPPPAAEPSGRLDAKPPTKRQIRAQIDIMLNEGLSAQEIASKLDISVAEVNLAINLRREK